MCVGVWVLWVLYDCKGARSGQRGSCNFPVEFVFHFRVICFACATSSLIPFLCYSLAAFFVAYFSADILTWPQRQLPFLALLL